MRRNEDFGVFEAILKLSGLPLPKEMEDVEGSRFIKYHKGHYKAVLEFELDSGERVGVLLEVYEDEYGDLPAVSHSAQFDKEFMYDYVRCVGEGETARKALDALDKYFRDKNQKERQKKELETLERLQKKYQENSYEIWSEGYMVTGGSGNATFHGISKGRTFREACDNYAKTDREFKKDYDSDRLTLWGCKLFDNAAEAKESFG